MSVRFFCDKCHRETASRAELRDLTLPAPNDSKKEVELCRWCIEKLWRWLEPEPIVGPA